MALARLALRPDARLATGALGLAAAILLPLAATLVVGALQPRVDGGAGWVAYRTDGAPLDMAGLPAPRLAVAEAVVDGQAWAAFTVGDAQVEPGHARAFGPGPATLAGRTLAVDGPPLDWPLLAPGRLVAHPSDLPAGAPVVAALFDRDVEAPGPGTVVVPARGADAFEAATTGELKAATALVILASVPAVALVAAVFTRQEMRERMHAAAVLASLGGTRQARLVLAGRITLAVALGALLAALAAAALWRAGGEPFQPHPFPWRALLLAGGAPAVAAWLAGLLALRGFGRRVERMLREGAQEPDAARPLPLPLLSRPLVLGTRLAPVLLLCAALFAVDVGFPLAAGQVPTALVGGAGEWVIGGERGLEVGAGVDAGPAAVLAHDGAVDAIVAETVAPTLLAGVAVVVRGGEWDALAAYHGLALAQGAAPSGHGVVLGERLAGRQGWRVGDALLLQGSHRPFAMMATVAGIAAAGGLLGDEAFAAPGLGRSLAGVGEGQATLVRLRPQTEAARDAVLRPEADIQVIHLTLAPAQPVAGQLALARVEGVNLGGKAGTRELTLRVNGEGVARAALTLPAHGHGDLAIPFLAPAGPLQVQVNPEVSAEAAQGAVRLEAPTLAFPGRTLAVQVMDGAGGRAGVAVGLFAGLEDAAARRAPLASAAADASGTASFAFPGVDVVAATLEGEPAARWVYAGRDPDAANLTVEQAWTVPAAPVPGQEAQLYATVRNRGGAAGAANIHVRLDGAIIQLQRAELASGAAATLQMALRLDRPAATLQVGEATVTLGTGPPQAAEGTPAPMPPDAATPPPPVRAGQGVQAGVADRLLGNARTTLLALGAVSLASTLAVVNLSARRALRSRRHVLGVLEALGQREDDIRARAAWEAGVMAGLAMLAVLPLAKLAFAALAAPWGPTAFAHALPDPVGWLFAVQAVAAFAAVAALAAFGVTGKVMRGG